MRWLPLVLACVVCTALAGSAAAQGVPEPTPVPGGAVVDPGDATVIGGDGTTNTDEGRIVAPDLSDQEPDQPNTITVGDIGRPPSCTADFDNWLEAQMAYEAIGGPAGDPGLVAALDPDLDGIACEEIMPATAPASAPPMVPATATSTPVP